MKIIKPHYYMRFLKHNQKCQTSLPCKDCRESGTAAACGGRGRRSATWRSNSPPDSRSSGTVKLIYWPGN